MYIINNSIRNTSNQFHAGTLSLLSPSSGRIGSKEPRRAPAGSQYLLWNLIRRIPALLNY